jgi:metal-responsive CopG/Arc/MetJ family transcriptional regulator
MTNLSIILPNTIAEDSTKVAKELGVSRTEFIRRAIIHELDNYKIKSEELVIIKSFNAMKKSTKYSKTSQKLMDSLFTDLPQEEDKWWDK